MAMIIRIAYNGTEEQLLFTANRSILYVLMDMTLSTINETIKSLRKSIEVMLLCVFSLRHFLCAFQ